MFLVVISEHPQGIAAALGHQEVLCPVTFGAVESWQFPQDLQSLANDHSLFIPLREKRMDGLSLHRQRKKGKSNMYGWPLVWG